VTDPYLIAFLLIVGIGSVTAYGLYLREKHEHLRAIESGICPKCGQKSIELTDQRSAGCGSKNLSFRCTACGYENSFHV
jgi:predicted RNA-binding Zn-ribbon protein involved in translation (DUF1610 family)